MKPQRSTPRLNVADAQRRIDAALHQDQAPAPPAPPQAPYDERLDPLLRLIARVAMQEGKP